MLEMRKVCKAIEDKFQGHVQHRVGPGEKPPAPRTTMLDEQTQSHLIGIADALDFEIRKINRPSSDVRSISDSFTALVRFLLATTADVRGCATAMAVLAPLSCGEPLDSLTCALDRFEDFFGKAAEKYAPSAITAGLEFDVVQE